MRSTRPNTFPQRQVLEEVSPVPGENVRRIEEDRSLSPSHCACPRYFETSDPQGNSAATTQTWCGFFLVAKQLIWPVHLTNTTSMKTYKEVAQMVLYFLYLHAHKNSSLAVISRTNNKTRCMGITFRGGKSQHAENLQTTVGFILFC